MGVVPIREVFSGPPGPENKALQFSSQARHHFTQADQVNLLVSASEADPDLGFMARLMALCSLPRTNPGNRLQYKRVNGPYKLIMIAGGDCKLPFGNLPRLLLAWVVRWPSSCGRWGSTTAAGNPKPGSATKWTGSFMPVSS